MMDSVGVVCQKRVCCVSPWRVPGREDHLKGRSLSSRSGGVAGRCRRKGKAHAGAPPKMPMSHGGERREQEF